MGRYTKDEMKAREKKKLSLEEYAKQAQRRDTERLRNGETASSVVKTPTKPEQAAADLGKTYVPPSTGLGRMSGSIARAIGQAMGGMIPQIGAKAAGIAATLPGAPAAPAEDWRTVLFKQLVGEPPPAVDRGAFLAPFAQAEQNLGAAYESARQAIDAQHPALRQQFAQMAADAAQQQAAISADIAQRLAQSASTLAPQLQAAGADVAAQGFSSAPVDQQAALLQQAQQTQGAGQQAFSQRLAQMAQQQTAAREQQAAGMVNAAGARLEANRAGALGDIGRQRAQAESQLQQYEARLAQDDYDRRLKAFEKIMELDSMTSPAEQVRARLASGENSPTLRVVEAALKDVDAGTVSPEDAIGKIRSNSKQLRDQGISVDEVVRMIRQAYDESAIKKKRTLEQLRNSGRLS